MKRESGEVYVAGHSSGLSRRPNVTPVISKEGCIMRLVHISDTHLGFFAYSRSDPDMGINQREADFYRAFARAVDRIMEIKPDIVVHAGDLFDGVRPQNRAIDFAIRQLIRLSESGVEIVLISGNHSTPKMRETGSIFRIFEHLNGIHPIHEPGISEVTVGDLTIHAIPHSTTPSMMDVLPRLKLSRDSRYNVLLVHAGIEGSSRYRTDHINQQMIALGTIPADLDYVALGHYHEFAKVRKGMFYSGSIERLGFGEVGQKKGIVEVDLARGNTQFHELGTRSMFDIESVDAGDLSGIEVFSEVKSRLEEVPLEGAIARLSIKNVRPEVARSLDVSSLKRLALDALHFDLKIERKDGDMHGEARDPSIGPLEREYVEYVRGLNIAEDRKKRLLSLGTSYFAEGTE
ncbi:MAG: DNA repair exonuclease [Methanobacteriota archaeon]|nr:MAG: DNA repair exonuclease [Euryarchaeota archaeon]